jgi:hypothetical protein
VGGKNWAPTREGEKFLTRFQQDQSLYRFHENEWLARIITLKLAVARVKKISAIPPGKVKNF